MCMCVAHANATCERNGLAICWCSACAALISLNAGVFLCRPCICEQAKDLSARLEETGAERDTLAAQLRDLKSDQEVWHRQKAILEGALASATAVSSEVSVLQVCTLAMCVVCYV